MRLGGFENLAEHQVHTATLRPHADAFDNFSASGVFEFRDTFHAIEHVTVTNGDVTRVEFEMGHLHFFGDC